MPESPFVIMIVLPRGYDAIVSFEGSDLHVMIEGSGPVPSSSQLLGELRGRVPAGTPIVVNTVTGALVMIGRVPS